jgi:hypothetical protein
MLFIVNAMDDENFASAVKATGRKKLIIAGVTNDVCTVYPALSLVRDGYEVQVVADGGGSPSVMADDIALRRMEKGGVTLPTTNQLIAELAGSWATPEGGQLVQLLMTALQVLNTPVSDLQNHDVWFCKSSGGQEGSLLLAVRGYLRQLRVRATFESTSHRPHWVESTAESGRSQAPTKLWRFSLGPWEISARH